MKYYIVAGEASGDLHGSNLVKALLVEDPQAQIRAWGGSQMRSAGAELVHDYSGSDVMGLTDVVAKGGKLLASLKQCRKDILDYAPDALILIDYPGFNMKLARYAHKHGLKVFYYIAPKTWASRSGRNKALKQYVDKLIVVFPFEKAYFEKAGVPFVYVGNPLVDAVAAHEFAPVSDKPYVALLPGSRKSEISRMMPVCMEVAGKMDLDMIIPVAPGRKPEDYSALCSADARVKLVENRTYDVLQGAQAAIVNSGTASLEAALLGVPQVVCWSTSRLTGWVARHVLRVMDHIKYISLANLILDREIFKELVQEDFTADKLSAELRVLLEDASAVQTMRENYNAVREALGGTGASRRAAEEIIKEIKHIQNS